MIVPDAIREFFFFGCSKVMRFLVASIRIFTIVRLYVKTEVEAKVEVEVEVQRVDSGGECYWFLVFGFWFRVVGFRVVNPQSYYAFLTALVKRPLRLCGVLLRLCAKQKDPRISAKFLRETKQVKVEVKKVNGKQVKNEK